MTDDAFIITDDNGRIFVGDDVVLDVIDGIGEGDDDDACGG